MAIETFAASAAFFSLYFLLHAQKKVPKKRAATAKRPHSRHARKPKSPMLAEITFRGLGRRQHPPPTSRSSAVPKHCASGPLHPQPHISSFQLRCCRLTIQLNERWPALKTAKINYDVCTFDEAPKAYNTGGYVFIYDSKWAITRHSGPIYDQN